MSFAIFARSVFIVTRLRRFKNVSMQIHDAANVNGK